MPNLKCVIVNIGGVFKVLMKLNGMATGFTAESIKDGIERIQINKNNFPA